MVGPTVHRADEGSYCHSEVLQGMEGKLANIMIVSGLKLICVLQFCDYSVLLSL